MNFISPPILQKGDVVGIVAPARKVSREEIATAITMLESWGLKVVLGKNIFGEYNQFSGTDSERAADFQSMIENHQIKAIICARGGYGSVRILSQIDLRYLQREPKWVVGYSDVTVFHGMLNSWYMMESIHGIMPINFPADGKPNISTESLRNVLFGETPTYNAQAHPFNRYGSASGYLIGGNLSILYSICGSDADVITEGKILFIEDLDEYLYHIDRMMMNLKRNGKLRGLAGLIVGGMTDMNDNTIPYGKSALEIIREMVEGYKYPVCFDFPAGHQKENVALIMGRSVNLKVDDNGTTLEFLPAK
ncbi:MAG: LD-carboxypeptidase [Bacteroidales bacterium]|nr:LD-carboxypeptidase [Bacteroidales bacterium]MDD4385419.1 LD-carboxypeptidase [Bacteroidales bacterium]